MPQAHTGITERRLVLKSESHWQSQRACLWSPSIHVADRTPKCGAPDLKVGSPGRRGDVTKP